LETRNGQFPSRKALQEQHYQNSITRNLRLLYLHLFPQRLEPKKENFCILPNFEPMPEEKDRDKPEGGDAWLGERPNAQNNWTQAKSDFATANTL
jgi:hypothetical protein